jgi:hypothetical protein
MYDVFVSLCNVSRFILFEETGRQGPTNSPPSCTNLLRCFLHFRSSLSRAFRIDYSLPPCPIPFLCSVHTFLLQSDHESSLMFRQWTENILSHRVCSPFYTPLNTAHSHTLDSLTLKFLVLPQFIESNTVKCMYVCMLIFLYHSNIRYCRSQWLCCLRCRFAAARLLRLRVRIPPVTWMFVCCECCVFVCATDWSLVQTSPTDCVVSMCVISKPQELGG